MAVEKTTLICCGAKGADSEWKIRASRAGHELRDCLPSDASLDNYRPLAKQVATFMGRRFPTSYTSIDRLLLRDVKAAEQTHQIYAIGYLASSTSVKGGTAWACMSMIMRNDSSDCLYFFDQNIAAWLKYDHRERRFVPMTQPPPVPSGVWLGIGSRNITPAGIAAIRALL